MLISQLTKLRAVENASINLQLLFRNQHSKMLWRNTKVQSTLKLHVFYPMDTTNDKQLLHHQLKRRKLNNQDQEL